MLHVLRESAGYVMCVSLMTLNPFIRSPLPSFKKVGHHRGVAVDAHRRRVECLALGEGLVVQHVGVTAALAIVGGEGVPGPHGFQPRVFLQLRARHHRSRIGFRRRVRHGFAAAVLGALHVDRASVEVVLHGEVLGPGRRIVDRVVQLHHAIKRVLGFLLTLEDIDQQRDDGDT